MSQRTYHPCRGDVVHLNLDPSAGHELTGPHFAVVLSTLAFAKATGFIIVVPGTTKFHPDPRLAGQNMMVKLPPLPAMKREGWLYPHQLKSLDYRQRDVAFVAHLDDDDFLIDLLDRVRAFLDPDSAI